MNADEWLQALIDEYYGRLDCKGCQFAEACKGHVALCRQVIVFAEACGVEGVKEAVEEYRRKLGTNG